MRPVPPAIEKSQLGIDPVGAKIPVTYCRRIAGLPLAGAVIKFFHPGNLPTIRGGIVVSLLLTVGVEKLEIGIGERRGGVKHDSERGYSEAIGIVNMAIQTQGRVDYNPAVT